MIELEDPCSIQDWLHFSIDLLGDKENVEANGAIAVEVFDFHWHAVLIDDLEVQLWYNDLLSSG